MIGDSAQTRFTPFSMRGPAPAAASRMQGMQIAPQGYQAPHFNYNIPPSGITIPKSAMPTRMPTGGMAQGMPMAGGFGNRLPVGAGAPTMPLAGAQPPVAYGGPPTAMNPQYQQALVSSLRNSGQ